MSSMQEKSELVRLFKKLTKGKKISPPKFMEMFKDRWVKIAAIILGITLLIIILVINPMRNKLRTLDGLIKDERYEVIEHISNVQDKMEEYRNSLPSGKDINWLIDMSVEAAQTVNITLTGVEPDDPEAFDQYENLSITVSTECGYVELIKYIMKLEEIMASAIVYRCALKNVGEKADITLKIGALMAPAGKQKPPPAESE